MKSILCFGDSNTWGYDPATKTRFSRNIRWTGVLQNCLEDDFYIIKFNTFIKISNSIQKIYYA